MRLNEFLDKEEIATGYYDPEHDEHQRRNPGDTRKAVLTLQALNRLKKMRALQNLESLKRQDILSVMYGEPEGDGGAMGMGF